MSTIVRLRREISFLSVSLCHSFCGTAAVAPNRRVSCLCRA